MTPPAAALSALVAVTALLSACDAYDHARYLRLLDGTVVDASPDAVDGATDGSLDSAIDARFDADDGAFDAAIDDGSICSAVECGPMRACCGGSCVDLGSDGANCGACGRACSHTVCMAGSCTNTCLFGFENCNDNIVDGCEAPVAVDAMNCGRCGHACNGAHAITSCVGGSCHIDSCAAGFADCDGDAANGCEADTANDPAHCGSCATACTAPENSTARCNAGTCGSTCNAGFADCDAATADGCEASLADALHCGDCATTCSASAATCSASGGMYACTNGCAAGLDRCGTSCVSFATDVNNCGTCGRVCAAPSGGSVSCSAGTCAPACPAGTTLCGTACIATSTDLSNCGSCGRACVTPTNGRATCTGGTCGIECNAGCTLEASGTSCNCVIVAPRPVAPLSTTRLTTQQPTLRWALAAGNDGAEITLCRDRALTTSCQTYTASGSSFALPAALARGTWFWRLRGLAGTTVGTRSSPVWQFVVPGRANPHDGSWGSVFDANGDGFGDYLAGAPLANGGTGAAHVYYGSATPMTPMSATLTSLGTGIGTSLASAGDFDGDGFADAIVGASTGPSAGWVVMFRGGVTGLETMWSANVSGVSGTGSSVASANDVDHDGYADFVFGSPSDRSGVGSVTLQYGDASGTFTARPRVTIVGSDSAGAFGSAVASGGDLDCDGHPDLVVGAPNANSGAGRVYVFYGDGAGFTMRMPPLAGTATGGHFGATVAIIGDVNADGCADLAVGRRPTTSTTPANVFLFYGSSVGVVSPANLTIPEPSTGPGFGTAIVPAGDINGDGYGEMFVGAPAAGIVYVYFGSATGITSTTARFTATLGAGSQFGAAIAPVTDVNGDQFDDLVAGAPGVSMQTGALGIATSTGTVLSALFTVASPDPVGAAFGQAVASSSVDTFRNRTLRSLPLSVWGEGAGG